jgi:hypothetical protein
MKKPTKHFGDELAKSIKQKGIKKKRICEILSRSFFYVNKHIGDGEFTNSEVERLRKNEII